MGHGGKQRLRPPPSLDFRRLFPKCPGLEILWHRQLCLGAQAGVQAGLESGVESGMKSGMQTGVQTGVQTGMESGVQAEVQAGA